MKQISDANWNVSSFFLILKLTTNEKFSQKIEMEKFLRKNEKKEIDGINLIIDVNSSSGRLRRLNKEYIALNSITTKSNIDLSPSFNKLH